MALTMLTLAAVTVTIGADAPLSDEIELAAVADFSALTTMSADVAADLATDLTIAPGMWQETPPGTQPDTAVAPFGEKGSMRWTVKGGGGVDVKNSDNIVAFGGAGLTYFIADNLSLNAELNGHVFDQRGGTEFGGELAFLFRWHFLAEDTWSLYFEGGAGMLGTTDEVPRGGSSFNFTPQGGLGATFDIGNNNRLMAGVRWLHVSNARLYDENPGRDHLVGYLGISFPY